MQQSEAHLRAQPGCDPTENGHTPGRGRVGTAGHSSPSPTLRRRAPVDTALQAAHPPASRLHGPAEGQGGGVGAAGRSSEGALQAEAAFSGPRHGPGRQSELELRGVGRAAGPAAGGAGAREVRFKLISQAYEVLSDPKKRDIYDQGGEQAIKEGGSGSPGFSSPMDIFDMFFGGGGRMARERRGKNVVHQLSVTLEDLYNGVTKKLALQKNVICEKCEGVGGKKGSVEKCPQCKGRGMQVHIQQIGPGMVQQIQTVCVECKGQGERINPKDRCESCHGAKVIREKKIIEVHVEKGMKDGQKILFHGEGDQEPELEPGDVIIVLDQKDHSVFQRRGHDLIMKMKIQLSEALCGFKKTLKTLDDRILVITSKSGEVVKHGDLKCVRDEGMPIYKAPLEKGILIIQFLVIFPEKHWLSLEKLPQLEALLPPRQKVRITDDMDQVELKEFSPSEQNWRQHREAYEEDEDGPRAGVQCQTA
uniref:DnaJ heat shock protein family (Hsp40) member A4 n=1 Tax=Callithrix jacchus TaxID=9483 RepID=F7EB50_CALJA